MPLIIRRSLRLLLFYRPILFKAILAEKDHLSVFIDQLEQGIAALLAVRPQPLGPPEPPVVGEGVLFQ